MRIECPALPYAYDALAPHMGAEMLHLHHNKHQKAFFAKLPASSKERISPASTSRRSSRALPRRAA